MVGASDRPIQLGDALYHYNQVWAITNTENTSMFSANQRLFGLTEATVSIPQCGTKLCLWPLLPGN